MKTKGYLQEGVHYPKGNLERAGSKQRATILELWFAIKETVIS
jgi:hypothetical protein